VKAAVPALVAGGGGIAAPRAIPILSPENCVRYSRPLGLEAPREERRELGALPQHLADRFCWANPVATVAKVYRPLPEADRRRAAILAGNYGQAGAIDLLGRPFGLPPAISGHNTYWLWGPGKTTGAVVVALGVRRADLESYFQQVEQAAEIISPFATPAETHLPVYVCRRLRRPLAEVWPKLKRFI